ncbi:MAG TPA: radical SAM protein, partial [Deferrisomatales bacterium]|nr:radical SAM protein [Deferrisomatales bacterium]
MKVVLLQPPVQDFYDTQVRLQPLGLCALKAAVELHLPGAEVRVRDYRQGWGRRTVKLPAELADLRAYYPVADRSPFSTFHNYYHFGAGFEELAEDVARERPDLVGISSLFSAYHREVLRCAEEIVARCDVPVVVGGTHASAAPESLLGHSAVAYVIRGEGERPLVELMRTLGEGRDPSGVPNLVYRSGERLVRNPSAENYALAELPPPDFSDLPVERYRFGRRPLASLTASRGCPHRCRFCSMHGAAGNSHRRRPVESILDEIRLRHAQGYRALDFEDDNLTLARGEMETLCRGLIEEYPEGELVLQAMNGVSYLSLDPELLGLMKRAGFTHLNLSLVSLDATTCRTMGRPHSAKAYVRIVRAAFRLGFRLVSYQILGLPGEALGSMIETLAFSARLPVLLG